MSERMGMDVMTRRDVLRGALGAGAVVAMSALPGSLAMASAAARFSSRRMSIAKSGALGPGGRDVILIPGLASGPSIWSRLARGLAGGHRVHIVHVAGFAGKAADANATGPLLVPLAGELARYIAESRMQSPALIGHSMGGTLAMMLALRKASNIASNIGRIMVVDMLPEGAEMLGGTSNGFGYLADQLNGYFTGTKAGRQLLADMIRQNPAARNSDPRVIAQALTELAKVDLGPRLADISCPMTVVHAISRDADVRVAQSKRFRAAYAHARQASIFGIGPAGHMVMLDQPDKFMEATRKFLL